ncbi:unnamed protein product, partial [Mesorhabditis spiculigera]
MVITSEFTTDAPTQPLHISLLDKYEYFAKERPDLIVFEIIVLRTKPDPLPKGVTDFEEMLKCKPDFDYRAIKFDMKEDLITLPYSSGTTGAPKGVMITHFNLASCLEMFLFNEKRKWAELGMPFDIVIGRNSLAILPQYHAMGMFTMVALTFMGIQQIMFRKFHLESMLMHIEKFDTTVLILVPAIINQMAFSPLLDKYDMSCLMTINSGSAPLSKNVIERLKERLPDINIRQSYGMTEMSLGCHFSVLNQPDNATGKLTANMSMKVVNQETGKECGPMEMGELRVKGPVIMKGYKNRPEDTKKTLDADGWLITGDLVYYDKEGFLYVCERAKELIKVKGAQVAPAELEDVILGHSGIVDCAVVGVQHEINGEAPRAFVVRKSDGVSEEDIHRFVNERVARYKQLTGGIIFVETIPPDPNWKDSKATPEGDVSCGEF